MREVGAMAQALMAGDIEAAVPLIDALREAGDWARAYEVTLLVGRLLRNVRPWPADNHNGVENLRRGLEDLFWPELPGWDDRLRAASEALRHGPSPLRSSYSGSTLRIDLDALADGGDAAALPQPP